MREDIAKVYKLLKKKYAPIANMTFENIKRNNWKIEMPKEMFPPLPSASFSARCAEAGFLRHDCGIITAFRSSRSLEENRAKNAELLDKIIESGIKHEDVIGWFKETRSSKPTEEESFFVYDDGPEHASEFFEKLYKLSEEYEQDSFLYKSAGPSRTAFLINTNEDSKRVERQKATERGEESTGDISEAGQLYLNLPLRVQKPATKTAKGRFAFRSTPPSAEEIDYSQKYK